MEPEHLSLFLLGVLQVIAIGLLSWVLLKVVELLDRIGHLEGQFSAFPIQQIANNRHRIEQVEKVIDNHEYRLKRIEKEAM